MKHIFLLLSFVAAVVLTSCSGSKFTSRRYTKGHYISHRSEATRPVAKVNDNRLIASVSKKLPVTTEKREIVLPAEKKSSAVAAPSTASHRKTVRTKTMFQPLLLKALAVKAKQPAADKIAGIKKEKPKSDGIEKNSLKGFIFSIIGLACAILGFALTVGLLAYWPLIFMVPALVFGILGLVKGLKGLSVHRREGGTTTDLVFGIIATAVGGLSIILALYFTIYGAIFVTITNTISTI